LNGCLKERNEEIDFTKGILILLMVVFHTTYVGIFATQYDLIKTFVYSFHMPGFLVLSGFLTNVNKSVKKFVVDNCRKIVLPYLIFEFLYITALFLVGKIGLETTNHVNSFSVKEIFKYLFIAPTGTYWYLHTLIICNFAYYLSKRVAKNNMVNEVIICSIILFLFSCFINIAIDNFVYYIIGIISRNINEKYSKVVKKSWLSIIPVVIIAIRILPNLNRFSVYGIIITYLMLSLCLAIADKLMVKRNIFTYLGENSYSFVLFSPIFTVSFKILLKYFSQIDPSGILYIICMTIITIAGCLFVAYILTKIKIGYYILGVKKFYHPYKKAYA
jgi:fucose 4-O-acetylase-like acetyltransferase